MILAVAYNESWVDFPDGPLEMRPICNSTIRGRMRRAFRAKHVSFQGRGFHHAHHRLSGIPGSCDLIVRRVLAPVPVLERRLEREYKILVHLAAHGYAHAPRPVRRIAPDEIDGASAFAMEYVAGTPIRFEPNLVTLLGQAIGKLHHIQVPDWLVSANLITHPVAIVANLWRNCASTFTAIQSSMPEPYRRQAQGLMSALPRYLQELDWSDATNVLLHGDLGEHNTLYDGHQLVLIDWEFAAVSDPTLDLMWLFSREGFGERERSIFFDAYCASYGPAPHAWQQRLAVLPVLGILNLALWAQSCINDVLAGRNEHFFTPDDLEYLQRQVQRLSEIDYLDFEGTRLTNLPTFRSSRR